MKNKKGYFVTLEGGEGSGKSTQLKLLEDYLDKGGYDVNIPENPAERLFRKKYARFCWAAKT